MRIAAAPRRRARISLIPLIDVMLVLLFFFMLATSYVDVGHTRLELAPASRAGVGGSDTTARLEVLADGMLRYGDEVRPLPELLPQLRALARDTPLRLAAAAGVSLQALLSALEQLQAAGLKVQLDGAAP